MHVDMRDDEHLWVTFNLPEGDSREVIIDKTDGHNDVRICDGSHVVKVRFTIDNKICDVLVDDVFVYPP